MKFTAVCIANRVSSEVRVLATHLAHASLDASIVCHDCRGEAAEIEALAKVPVLAMDTGYRVGRTQWERAIARARRLSLMRLRNPGLQRLIRSTEPGLVYSSQQLLDSAAAIEAAMSLAVPYVMHMHYNVSEWLGEPALRRMHQAAHIVAVSDFIRDQVIAHGVPEERVTTVHNTIDPSGFDADAREAVRHELRIPDDAVVVAQVARMDMPFKGWEDTIRATAPTRAHLMLVGEGPLRRELERLVTELGIASRVTFTGFRSDVARVLSAADVFAHPSMWEPFGLAVLEAMAARLPVVAWAHGGILETVQDGITGLLAPPGDPAALAEAVARLVTHESMRRDMGAAGRERAVSCFDSASGGARFTEVIEAVGRA